MYNLRIIQSILGENLQKIVISLKAGKETQEVPYIIHLSELPYQDQKNLRWYLEDYLQYPQDPNPEFANQIEKRMIEIGEDLFRRIFFGSENAIHIWEEVRSNLSDFQIEIISEDEGNSIPWELMRDPDTGNFIALEAKAFVRLNSHLCKQSTCLDIGAGSIRILLVITRPAGKGDPPFRSVASNIVKNLGTHSHFRLESLRPPTFDRLIQVLEEAKADNDPYQIVHFDGHGTYEELPEEDKALLPGTWRQGGNGYVIFENLSNTSNKKYIDGRSMGKLLAKNGVPILVLNACRSAFVEYPKTWPAGKEADDSNAHSRIKAFNSFAQDVIESGAISVVAMRYNIYVATAARFIGHLYSSLSKGLTLGESVTAGRRLLYNNPERDVGIGSRILRDWMVPIQFGFPNIRLLISRDAQKKPTLEKYELGALHIMDSKIPSSPEMDFIGGDNTLLEMDRAFDIHKVILLHAYAGSGKTAIAAEFAQWYSITGGVKGPVLFTSFQQYMPISQIINNVGQMFEVMLERSNIHWLDLSEEDKINLTIEIFKKYPVLWIWDNIEEVSGFPNNSNSSWTQEEQNRLADFLNKAASQTQAKFLLTSRREETSWLGDLPERIKVQPMNILESAELSRNIAKRHGTKLDDMANWMPLFGFAQGNPLTIIVVVNQAINQGFKTRDDILKFVAELQSGEEAFADEITDGRSRSLGASLSYGFHVFTETEKKVVSLLHLFQGFVRPKVLLLMGNMEYGLTELKSYSPDAIETLLKRASDVGLLSAAPQKGGYNVHPAIPWFLKRYFNQYYPDESRPIFAFIKAICNLGYNYFEQYKLGHQEVLDLNNDEANLLYARQLAIDYELRSEIIYLMLGLEVFYYDKGQRLEWARLVEEILPLYIDLSTDHPLIGYEDEWGTLTEWRIRLARDKLDLEEAKKLTQMRVNAYRQRAEKSSEPDTIRNLAICIYEMGQIKREMRNSDCVQDYVEAIKWADKINDTEIIAKCYLNLGNSYIYLEDIQNLELSEDYFRKSLDLKDMRDIVGKGICYCNLGYVANKRYQLGKDSGKTEKDIKADFDAALENYNKALEYLPDYAYDRKGDVYDHMVILYSYDKDYKNAQEYYQRAVECYEKAHNVFKAGNTRLHMALALEQAGSFEDALKYADAALSDYNKLGDGASSNAKSAQDLIQGLKK